MKNADKPINPIKGADDIFFNEGDESYIKQVEPFLGLTKREYFAGVALQGILSNRWTLEFGNYNEEKKAEMAIRQADELLKQLEDD